MINTSHHIAYREREIAGSTIMGVLGKLPTKGLIHFGAVELLTVILVCYTIAVKEGHVKPWLPTISACGEHPPEWYIFRYGILVGGMLLVILALYIYTADFPFSHSSVNLGLGVSAGLLLGVIAICAANENRLVHLAASYSYFVLEDILMIRITLQGLHSLSKVSTAVKAVCTTIACLITIAKLVMMAHHVPEVIHLSSDIPVIPILEWSNTFVMLGFHWSFAFDFSPDYDLAAWKAVSSEKEEKVREDEEEMTSREAVKVPLL